MISPRTYQVLFLCTGNSARSIMAEYLLRTLGKGRFETFSAGSNPTGRVNPFTVEVLERHFAIDARSARSKSWDEFRDRSFDFVITVCDQARQTCPRWPGQPVMAHWSSPDPSAATGDDVQIRRTFLDVATQIHRRVGLLCAFRDEQLTAWQLQGVGDQFTLTGMPSQHGNAPASL